MKPGDGGVVEGMRGKFFHLFWAERNGKINLEMLEYLDSKVAENKDYFRGRDDQINACEDLAFYLPNLMTCFERSS